MIYQNYKKHVFYTAFAAILGIALLAMSDISVKSQRMADFKLSPFKFNPLPAPKKDVANIISATASAGDLDPMFGTGGKLTTDFGSSENANAVAVQTDGKIVAAGSVIVVGSNNATNYDFAVFRYNADGSLDTSFDGDGKVTTPISTLFNNYDIAYAVAIQTDGKIIAAGTSGDFSSVRFTLVRYNTDGSLDNSFGAGGIVINDWYIGKIYEIAIQTDGKIVAAGGGDGPYGGYVGDFRIARYNPNGSLDASFGTGGIVTTNFGDAEKTATSIALQADGKIVAAGYTGFYDYNDDSGYYDFALARYNTDGSLDTSFDTDGKLTTTFGLDYETANAVVIQGDGKIVVCGYGASNTDYIGSFAVARYNGDGTLDASFDGDGKVTVNFGGYSSFASSVALQSNGKIVVSGGAGNDFALVRLNTEGSLDTSFDTDGKVTTDFGYGERAYAVAIQADGKIVAAGYIYDNGNFDFALSRYNTDGSLDSAFDGDGKVTTSLLVASSAVNAVVIDERPGHTRTTFFVGYANNGANDDFAISNPAYNVPIRGIIPIGNSDDRANAAAFDPIYNSIIAVGYSYNGSNNDFALYRGYSFGTNGKVTTDFGGNDVATAVAFKRTIKLSLSVKRARAAARLWFSPAITTTVRLIFRLEQTAE